MNWLCFHVNVGKVILADGRYFDTGLPKGFLDLLIITDFGKVIFIETKIKPRKPSEEQHNFIIELKKRGFIADVIYDLNEFNCFLIDNKLKIS